MLNIVQLEESFHVSSVTSDEPSCRPAEPSSRARAGPLSTSARSPRPAGSRWSIYNRFGSKSQLVAATVEKHLAEDLLPSPGLRACGPALLRGMAVSSGWRRAAKPYQAFSPSQLSAFPRRNWTPASVEWAVLGAHQQFLLAVLADPGAPRDIFHEGFPPRTLSTCCSPAVGRPAAERRALRPHPCLIRRTIY